MSQTPHPGRIVTVAIGGTEIAQRDANGALLYTCCAHKARKCNTGGKS